MTRRTKLKVAMTFAVTAALAATAVAGLAGTAAGHATASPSWCGVFCAKQTSPPPAWCGKKKITVALADGFADNNWRKQTSAEAINEASKCPNVTDYTHTDGQGNTQKSISDIQGLAAKGVNAIVVFADAGKAVLPAIHAAFKQGSVVVPYRVSAGGKAGQDYSVFVGTDFRNDGVIWATWMAKALHGKGNVVYLGGPPATTESLTKAKGIASVFKKYPGIHWIGQKPYEVTNWDPSLTTKVLTALVAKYPKIDGVIADLASAVGTSFGVFDRAHRPYPAVAGEDSNALGCTWMKVHKKQSSFQIGTVSSETWNVRLAMRKAISMAAAGKDPEGNNVKNYTFDDSLKGKVKCNPSLPADAFNSDQLTPTQIKASLK